MQNKNGITVSIIAACVLGIAVLLPTGSVNSAGDPKGEPAANHASSNDLYNPTRVALVNARRQLMLTLTQEQEILDRRRRVQAELDSSLDLLSDAQHIDPSLKVRIDSLRTRIADLENVPRDIHTDDHKLREYYDQLLAEFDALIEHY